MITLKVTKKQGFILSLEDTFLEKPQMGVKLSNWPQLLLQIDRTGLLHLFQHDVLFTVVGSGFVSIEFASSMMLFAKLGRYSIGQF